MRNILLLGTIVAGFAFNAIAIQPPAAPLPGTRVKKGEKAEIDPSVILQMGIAAGSLRGSSAVDATGKVTAKIVGNPMRNDIGPGTGFKFNGTSDWMTIADEIGTSRTGLPTTEFTVSTWVSIEKTAEAGAIIGCVSDKPNQQGGWVLGYKNDAFSFGLATKGGGDKLTYVTGKTKLVPGKWYNVVGTYDGKTMKLYVNGQPDGESKDQSGEIAYSKSAAYTVCALNDGTRKVPMAGTLLEVKVSSRVLTPQQVTDEYIPGVRLATYEPVIETTQRFVVKSFLQFATTDSIIVVWETSQPSQGWVEYGEQLPYSQKTDKGPVQKVHKIKITGLKPETPYFYRVHATSADGNEIVGEDLTFQTAVLPETAFAFAIIGDTQKNKPVIEKLQAFAYTLRPSFEIHLGDVVDKGPDRNEWVDELLAGSWPLMSRVPMYPAIGNHEENHSNYYTYFALPAPECWYTYTYGNAQFFVIDTNKPVDPGSEQYAWLEGELKKSKATWKFTYHHHPIYSSDEDDYGDTYKGKSVFGDPRHRYLAGLFEKYGVDIDFAGHIHAYERTWPIKADKVDEVNGVRYITSGGGGGGLESVGPSRTWFSQRTYKGHHICLAMIHDKTLQYQMFDLEGRLFDQFEIKKK